ncbi:MAG: GGDEF domain-containing protein [Comamonas sp.]
MLAILLTPSTPEAGSKQSCREALVRLLRQQQLSAVFQPLIYLQTGQTLGYEALIRGPLASSLHRPDALFAAAQRAGMNTLLEKACARQALETWCARQPAAREAHGLLFLNMSAHALIQTCHETPPSRWPAVLPKNLALSRLVIEITEHNRVDDIQALQAVRQSLQDCGVRLALDDFGDGHTNLRLWHELKPDFLKIDKYFSRDIANAKEKQRLMRSIQEISQVLGSTLIAEGIETEQDWKILRDLGIAIGQGFFLGRPGPLPASTPSTPSVSRQNLHLTTATEASAARPPRAVTPGILQQLELTSAPIVTPHTTHSDVATLFQNHPELHAVAVITQDGLPVGLINRRHFINQFAKLYFREVHGKKPCMVSANPSPRIVERSDRISDLLGILTSSDQRYLADGIIVVDQGRYVGLVTGEQLVRAVTEARIEAARHANPLTQLPGNIPINMHVQRLLGEGRPFMACYADLDHFKPFNDRYGYRRGDDMIRLLASLATAHCQPELDFVGHIGGDDFMLLMCSPDWEQRARAICTAFAQHAANEFDAATRAAGGFEAEDRNGQRQFFPCTTVSIGAVPIDPRQFRDAETVAEAAAAAKREAKRLRQGVHLLAPPV